MNGGVEGWLPGICGLPSFGEGGGLAMAPSFLIFRSENSYSHNLQPLYVSIFECLNEI